MWLFLTLACQSTSNSPKSELNSEVPSQGSAEDAPKSAVDPAQDVRLYFAKSGDCVNDCIQQVNRKAVIWTPQSALDALYNGPLDSESGLQFIACQSTSATIQSIEDGVAKVQLNEACGGCGTQTVADLIEPTLLEFDAISVVQIYDPQGHTQLDDPKKSSRPGCLEP